MAIASELHFSIFRTFLVPGQGLVPYWLDFRGVQASTGIALVKGCSEAVYSQI
jgi:hypothetical protein